MQEWKEKASDMAREKAQEMSTMVQDRIATLQDRMKGKWDDITEKTDLKEKVDALQKKNDLLKKQLSK